MYAYIKTKNVQWTHENKRKCSSLSPSIPGRSIGGGWGVPDFLEDWRLAFLSVENWRIGKITEVKMDSLKMWISEKAKIKCEERPLIYEDCEAETPWYQ